MSLYLHHVHGVLAQGYEQLPSPYVPLRRIYSNDGYNGPLNHRHS